MSYRVFARKYRPQKFEEVVGQEHITRTLQNAIKGSRLAQAYLFVGPRGVGKTSSARILAKALNCQQGPTDNPCGTCDACVEIAEGRSLDVLEIDGASNNSVESVRTLRENAAYAPARGPYKVYLIDEVHMLSTAAFNALLKTLEEPPEHVKFLFATTEVQKVPATILSRCQRFDLRRLTPELIAAHLLHIASEEKITLRPEAAEAIARGADGAMRDAESMLDQVVAFCGTKIGADDVHQVFGFTPRETVLELGGALLGRDTPAALALVKGQAEAGKDLARLLGDLVGLLRDVLVSKAHPSAPPTEESRLGGSVAQEKLLLLLDHFGEAEGRLRWATDKKLQLDVALIKGVHLLEETSLSEVLDVLTTLRGGHPLPAVTVAATRPSVPVPTPRPAAPPSGSSLPGTSAVKAPPSPHTPDVPFPPMPPNHGATVSVPALPTGSADPWKPIAMAMASDSPFKFGWLEDGVFVELSGDTVVVEFPASFEQQAKTPFWTQALKNIEEQLSGRLGAKARLECRFTGAEPPAPEPMTPSPAPASPKTPSPPPPADIPARGQEKAAAPAPAISPEEIAEFKNDPLIRKAMEVFKAELLTGPQGEGQPA